MKTSSKYALIVLGVIAALVIILTVMVRAMVKDHIVVDNHSGEKYSIDFGTDSDAMTSGEYDFEDFDEIRIVGGWDVLVIASDEFDVSVKTNAEKPNRIRVEQRGDELYLGFDYDGARHDSEFHGASATVYMPVLEAVDVDGAVNMNIEDFTLDGLDFGLDGAGQIIGEGCDIENLFIRSAGAVNVDFNDCDVENAEIYVDGAGNVELNMSGGELTGRLSGLSHLEYSGEISLLDVEKDGIGGISKKD